MAPVSAVSSAIQANDAHRAALNARRALLKRQLENGDIMLENMDKFVDPALEEVRVKNLDEWAVFAIGATTVRPLLTNKQLIADDSPFREEAENRKLYLAYTSSHPWTNRERLALRKQVINENRRLSALELHRINQSDSLDGIAEQDDSNFEKNVEDIDWRRVASNMSEVARSTLGKRTAQECKVQWIGNDHPSLRDMATWDHDEDELLRDLIGDRNVRSGDVDWVELAAQFKGARTPAQCLSRWILLEEDEDASSDANAPWTPEEDDDFQAALEEHGVGNWAAISLAMESTRSPAACANRYAQTLRPDIKRGAWSVDEDDKLREAVAVHGQKWSRVRDLVPGRTAAQCRERSVRALSLTSNAKVGAWTKKEDARLRQLVSTLGADNWDSVAKCISRRDAAQCCKRWHQVQSDRDETSEGDSVPPKKRGRPKGTVTSNRAKAAASTPSTVSTSASASSGRQDQAWLSKEQTSGSVPCTSAAVPDSVPLSVSAQVATSAAAQEMVSNDPGLSPLPHQAETQGPTASTRKKPGLKPKPRYTGPSTVFSNSDIVTQGTCEPQTSAGDGAIPSTSTTIPGGAAEDAVVGAAAPSVGLRRSLRLRKG